MQLSEIKDGVFFDKENILEQMAEAHRKGLFTDITFTMSDNVKISTSKFMLACRSSYFATMFFDESSYNRRRKKAFLESGFDSKTMEKLLDFMWYGKVNFSDMDIQSLLNFLRISTSISHNSLIKGVSDFLKSLIMSKKIELEDCLVAFDYAIYNNYESLSECLLTYIYQNLQDIKNIPQFKDLNSRSILHILKNGKTKVKIIDLFSVFTFWVEDKKDLEENERLELLRCFDLEKFTRSEIQNVVRKTNLFKEKEIFEVLEVKYDEIEKTLRSFMDQESIPPHAPEKIGKRKAKQANMEKKIKKQEFYPTELSVKQEFDDKDGDDNSSTDNGQKEEEYFENGKYEKDVKQELKDMLHRPNGSIRKHRCAICSLVFDNRNEIELHWKSDCKLVNSVHTLYSCGICRFKSKTVDEMKYHWRVECSFFDPKTVIKKPVKNN